MDHITFPYTTQSCKKVECKETQHTFIYGTYRYAHLATFGWPQESGRSAITVTVGGKEKVSVHYQSLEEFATFELTMSRLNLRLPVARVYALM